MSATPEQPPAAPDEPVTSVHEPTFAAPAPVAEPPSAPPPPVNPGRSFIDQHPEALVGSALVGGALFAMILKSLGRR